MESRCKLPRCLSLALLAAVLSTWSGCSHGSGGLAFRRFWGFDFQQNHQSARDGAGERLGGLVTNWMGKTSSADGSVDPFLTEDFAGAAEVGTNGQNAGSALRNHNSSKTANRAEPLHRETAALMPFENSPEKPETPPAAPAETEAETPEGNPFRLVQHEPTVNEISSTQSSDDQAASSASDEIAPKIVPNPTGRNAQLNRLKTALSRDAEVPLPSRGQLAGKEVARQRVEAIMKNARHQMQMGEYRTALRWALAAERLAERSELFFGPDEDPPADLVRILQDRLNVSPEPPPAAENTVADESGPATSSPSQADSGASVQPPTLTVEFPTDETTEPDGSDQPTPAKEAGSLPHSTRAMQEAAIAPETSKSQKKTERPEESSATIEPGRQHVQSLKVDARRVAANQGAVVSVEGPLNPPKKSSRRKLAWAPPAEEDFTPPPFEMAMSEPAHHPTATPPPLPPPNSVKETQPPEPPEFLYAEETEPPSKRVKNVQWNDNETSETSSPQARWWVFPVLGFVGLLLLSGLYFKRKRG